MPNFFRRIPEIGLTLFFVLTACIALAESANAPLWQKITVAPNVYQVEGAPGVTREITPSCSGGPLCKLDPTTQQVTCRKAKTEFAFFFKPGKIKQLLVHFDGGGACWDPNTCISAPAVPLSIYTAEIGPNLNPEKMGGLFDLGNSRNPYRDWNMVYVPYCTADIHWGSADTEYPDSRGALTGAPASKLTIHHRGFDNFLYVREWLKNRYDGSSRQKESKNPLSQLLVTGSSAGAYGAAVAYPYLKNTFPSARGYLLADSGNGVITDAFLQQAIVSPHSAWNAKNNFATWIPGMDELLEKPADAFLEHYYTLLGRHYPGDRFSQYMTQWDAIQAFFFHVMLHQNNIPLWRQVSNLSYAEWHAELLDKVAVTSAANTNFRYFIAPGCNHTLLRTNDDFYNLKATQSASFLSWFKSLTTEYDDEEGSYPRNWKNISCANCATPPTPEEIKACMERTFTR